MLTENINQLTYFVSEKSYRKEKFVKVNPNFSTMDVEYILNKYYMLNALERTPSAGYEGNPNIQSVFEFRYQQTAIQVMFCNLKPYDMIKKFPVNMSMIYFDGKIKPF